MTIYVGNLSPAVEAYHLQNLFEPYGAVTKVILPMDKITGRPKGFAFVDMENESDEEAAVAALGDAELLDRMLKITKANAPDESSESNSSKEHRSTSRSRSTEHSASRRSDSHSSERRRYSSDDSE